MAFHLTLPPPSSSVSILKMAACVPSVGAWFWRKQNRPCSQRTVFILTCLEGPGRTDARVLPLFHPTQKLLRVAKRIHTEGVSLKL